MIDKDAVASKILFFCSNILFCFLRLRKQCDNYCGAGIVATLIQVCEYSCFTFQSNSSDWPNHSLWLLDSWYSSFQVVWQIWQSCSTESGFLRKQCSCGDIGFMGLCLILIQTALRSLDWLNFVIERSLFLVFLEETSWTSSMKTYKPCQSPILI